MADGVNAHKFYGVCSINNRFSLSSATEDSRTASSSARSATHVHWAPGCTRRGAPWPYGASKDAVSGCSAALRGGGPARAPPAIAAFFDLSSLPSYVCPRSTAYVTVVTVVPARAPIV